MERCSNELIVEILFLSEQRPWKVLRFRRTNQRFGHNILRGEYVTSRVLNGGNWAVFVGPRVMHAREREMIPRAMPPFTKTAFDEEVEPARLHLLQNFGSDPLVSWKQIADISVRAETLTLMGEMNSQFEAHVYAEVTHLHVMDTCLKQLSPLQFPALESIHLALNDYSFLLRIPSYFAARVRIVERLQVIRSSEDRCDHGFYRTLPSTWRKFGMVEEVFDPEHMDDFLNQRDIFPRMRKFSYVFADSVDEVYLAVSNILQVRRLTEIEVSAVFDVAEILFGSQHLLDGIEPKAKRMKLTVEMSDSRWFSLPEPTQNKGRERLTKIGLLLAERVDLEIKKPVSIENFSCRERDVFIPVGSCETMDMYRGTVEVRRDWGGLLPLMVDTNNE